MCETAAFGLDGRMGLKKNFIGQVKNIPLLDPLSKPSSLEGLGLAAGHSSQTQPGAPIRLACTMQDRHAPVLPVLFSSMSCGRGPKLWLTPRFNSLTRVDLQLCFLLRRILALDRIHVREGWNVPWYLGTRY